MFGRVASTPRSMPPTQVRSRDGWLAARSENGSFFDMSENPRPSEGLTRFAAVTRRQFAASVGRRLDGLIDRLLWPRCRWSLQAATRMLSRDLVPRRLHPSTDDIAVAPWPGLDGDEVRVVANEHEPGFAGNDAIIDKKRKEPPESTDGSWVCVSRESAMLPCVGVANRSRYRRCRVGTRPLAWTARERPPAQKWSTHQ